MKRLHEELGHFGVKRVISMLQRNYWWRGIGDDVVRVVGACMPCARVKAGFQESLQELRPLPLCELGYRWGVDLVGDSPITAKGNKYVKIAVEHFTKWVELVPIRSKSSTDVAHAFLDEVLSRFGAPREVLTD